MNNISKHYLAITILRLSEKKKRHIADCLQKIEIEKAKPDTQRFLFANEGFYRSEITEAENALKWLKTRYENLIKSLCDENKN